jgi:hypothetical protein
MWKIFPTRLGNMQSASGFSGCPLSHSAPARSQHLRPCLKRHLSHINKPSCARFPSFSSITRPSPSMHHRSFKRLARTWSSFASELNFFRIHVIFLCATSLWSSSSHAEANPWSSSTLTPLILAAIFFAANGRYHVSYVDALFNGISSMACCGLATINLSSLTGFQQFLLFLQFNIGNTVSLPLHGL